MEEKLYRIKPLVWENRIDDEITLSAFGQYRVWSEDIGYSYGKYYKWEFRSNVCQKEDEVGTAFNFNAAQEKAESHYRERLMMCLEPISVTVTNDGVYLSVS